MHLETNFSTKSFSCFCIFYFLGIQNVLGHSITSKHDTKSSEKWQIQSPYPNSLKKANCVIQVMYLMYSLIFCNYWTNKTDNTHINDSFLSCNCQLWQLLQMFVIDIDFAVLLFKFLITEKKKILLYFIIEIAFLMFVYIICFIVVLFLCVN